MITDRPRRLTGASYAGLQRYSVTFCTAFRKPIFDDHAVGRDAASQILQTARESQFDLVRTA